MNIAIAIILLLFLLYKAKQHFEILSMIKVEQNSDYRVMFFQDLISNEKI